MSQYHQPCLRQDLSAPEESLPLLSQEQPRLKTATKILVMILTTLKRETRTQISMTLTMVSKNPRLPLPRPPQHQLYSHYHLYVQDVTARKSTSELTSSTQPIPDFDGMDSDDIVRTTEPYLNALFPTIAGDDEPPTLPLPTKGDPIFLTQRSASLWSQLVAPPPLQPPDWIRSRIRRLFLVSLGVPVDLDEILPASKQKKLVLPSVLSPRTSSDSRRSGSRPSRLKSPRPSNTSGDGGGGGGGSGGAGSDAGTTTASKRRGAPAPPHFDLVAARQLCATTDEALDGMTDAELQAHVQRLQGLEGTATDVLSFWKERTDEQIKEREAFEGVIENLVKHARKTRK